MSPITHVLMGWTIGSQLETKKARSLVAIAGILPDIDGLTLLGGVEYYHKYHHTFGHNVFTGLLYSIICSLFIKDKSKFIIICLLAFHSHLLADIVGSGADWGITYFWPIGSIEYFSIAPFQWELDSWQNILTTVILMVTIFFIGIKKEHTIIEMISVRLDKVIVATFKRWWALVLGTV